MVFLIILGILLRILVFFNFNAGYDASYYITLGKGYATKGAPYLPFGEIETPSMEPTQGTSTRQAFPLFLSSFYVLFGSGYLVSKIAVTFLSFLALVVVYITTRDLFGKDNALIVTGLIAVTSILITMTGILYIENLTFLLFTLGLWGLYKGGKCFPLGMIFLSFFYISRLYSLELYLVLICLLFSWLAWTKPDGKLSKFHFIGALTCIPFASLLYFSNINSDFPVNRCSLPFAVMTDPCFIAAHYVQLVFFCLIWVLGFAIYFYEPLKKSFSLKNILWIVVAGFLFGVPLAMAYQDYVYGIYTRVPKEGLRAIFYVALPLLWLAVPNAKIHLDEPLRLKEVPRNLGQVRKNPKLLALMLVALGTTIVFFPWKWLMFPLGIALGSLFMPHIKWKVVLLGFMLVVVAVSDNTGIRYDHCRRLGEDIDELVENGDVIMLDGIDYVKANGSSHFDRYVLAPYVTKRYEIVNFDTNKTADFIITQNNSKAFHNYTILKKYYSYDKRGIFTQLSNEFHRIFLGCGGAEDIPVYILWIRDDKEPILASGI